MSFYAELNSSITQEFEYNDEQKRFSSYILTKKNEVEITLKNIRNEVDKEFRNKRRTFLESGSRAKEAGVGVNLSKYPIGHCGPITIRVLEMFEKTSLYKEFVSQGVIIKRIYGIVGNESFNNAIQIGLFYCNIAGDTISRRKPKFDFKPISENVFRNFDSFKEYFKVCKSYWECQIFINPILELTLLFPFVIKIGDEVILNRNIPRRLTLNSFLNHHEEINQILFNNSKYMDKELNEEEIKSLIFHLKASKKLRIHKFRILSNLELKKQRKELENIRARNPEEFDKNLYLTYVQGLE